ncbi:Uncharacterized protein CK203_010662 [Vitis vinifera]|uniref:Erythronate-4-phosphate dehydrogenase family protein n=1 Tax=Vitis vinifera TaxID=29760 RepID=A0A438JT36_VITVI|nr:Uncharacterized protein CK203_010662 [Vitis vinifera]
MEKSYEPANGNGFTDNGHRTMRYSPYQPCIKVSLSWLDIRVFYVRVSKCEIDDSTPEYLTLNHIPLNRDTLLEVNGVRSSIYSDGVSTLLRRDRLDKKSEEATFVSTDSVRMTGSVKFEGKQYMGGPESASPAIEVYIAGCFSATPIILTKTLQLTLRKKQIRKGMLDSIPEYDATECQKDETAGLSLQKLLMLLSGECNLILDGSGEYVVSFDPASPNCHLVASRISCMQMLQISEHPNYKPENEDYNSLYSGTEYLEGEDGELSWFTAGVRVGVGIGLSFCLGIGIGVGLLVRTYQGTTNNFRRRLLKCMNRVRSTAETIEPLNKRVIVTMQSKGIDSSETMIMELERDLDNLLWVVLFAYGLNFLFH